MGTWTTPAADTPRQARPGAPHSAFGFWSVVLLLAAVVGLAIVALSSPPDKVTCDGKEMRPDQLCGRFGLGGDTYEEVEKRQRENYADVERLGSTLFRTAGLGAVVLLALAVLVRVTMPARPRGAPPGRIDRLARGRGLGGFQRAYRRGDNGGLSVAVGALVAALILSVQVRTHFLPVSAPVTVVITGLLILAAAVGLVWTSVSLVRFTRGLYRYAGGVVDDWRGPTVIGWDHVYDLRVTIAASDARSRNPTLVTQYELRGRGFAPVRWSGATLCDLDDLAGAAVANVTAAQMPGALDRLAAGETVMFGPKLGARQHGITIGEAHLPWAAVARLQLTANGHVSFPAGVGAAVRLRQREVANLPLLKTLALQISARQR